MDKQIIKELKEGTEPEVFGEALAFLEQKGVIRYEDFRKLKEWYRPLAFSVAGYTELEVLNQFLEELKKAIEEGTTKAQFQENMDRFLEERGYDGLTPYHADRIFRQNMLTAYSVGHYQQMTDPDVTGRRKYWQYQTAGDGHVRESHAAMDGRVFPADSPVWDIWYPPNGFGCRCMVVSRTEEQVRRMGLTVEQALPDTSNMATGETEALLPDPKFRTNPAKAEWKPDLAAFPPVLRRLYQEQQKARKANPDRPAGNSSPG